MGLHWATQSLAHFYELLLLQFSWTQSTEHFDILPCNVLEDSTLHYSILEQIIPCLGIDYQTAVKYKKLCPLFWTILQMCVTQFVLTALHLTAVYLNALYIVGAQIIRLHWITQYFAQSLNYSLIVSYSSFLDCTVLYFYVLLSS